MNKLLKISIFTVFLLLPLVTKAQLPLSIDTIFNEYGKKEGSILINLAKDILGRHTNIDNYKCLTIDFSQAAQKRVSDAVMRDFLREGRKANTLIMKEIKKNGKIETFYFSIGIQNKTAERTYILYKIKDKKITLIYIKGKFVEEKFESELKELKNLFIEVNNQKIKL